MKTQRRRSKALLLALATVLVCVVAVGMWRFLGQPSVSSDASASSTPVVSDQVEATTTDSAQADDQTVETGENQTGESDDAATSDADYQQRVDEAQAADEAAGAGTSFEAGKALVTLADGATVDQVNAMLATMDGVSTKVVSDEDISNGYLLVDVAPTTSVEAATAELEQSEVVSAAQPNYLYQLMDEQIGTISDLMEQTSPLTATEPVTQLAADKTAETDASAADAKTDADATTDATTDAATTDATTDAATTEAVTTDEAAAASARQDAEAASTAATTTETTGAEALVATVQGISLNDDYWSLQWALHDTTGKTASVHADEAWTIQKTNKAVSVAIIDTGALTTHEDLDDNVVATYNSLTKGTDVTDTYGHGTHVAGIVSAESNNSTGVSGSSYDADLVIVKAANPNGGFSDAALLEAYSWIKDNASTYNIKVINMSLGGGGTPTSDDALMGEIDAAKTAGILTVCAAGNSVTSDYSDLPYAEYPGDYSSVLSVINLQYLSSNGTFLPARSSGSNYNVAGTTKDGSYTKDVSAPGTNIISTTKDGSYGNKTGTSMASPCVAGVAALLFAANTDITPDQVMGDLEATATDLNGDSTGTPTGDNVGWDVYTGYGEVNAYKAVLSANEVSIAGEDAVLLKSTLDLDATASTGTVTSWSWSSTDATVATVDDGVVTGAKAGTATITATATLSDGSTVSGSKKVTVIDASLSGPSFVGKDSTNTYSVAGGESLAWTYSTTNASIAPIAEGSGVLTAKEAGTVTVTATCVAHPTIKVTTRVTVVDASISGAPSVGIGGTTTLTVSASSDVGTWTWDTSDASVATIDAAGVLSGLTYGKVTVSATLSSNPAIILTKQVAVTHKSGWSEEDGSIRYYDEDGYRIQSDWLVTGVTSPLGGGGGLQRYWFDADGNLAVSRTLTTADGLGWNAYATEYGYVLRGAATCSDGRMRYADNDGRITDGWLVTDAFGQGLQRYWVSGGAVATECYVSPDDAGWAAWATRYGYVVRGSYVASDGTVYLADNDGRLAGGGEGGWVVSSAYGQGLQRYWVDSATHGCVPGFSTDGWAHYTFPDGYVLRGRYTASDGHTYVADNDGRIIS